MKIHKVKPILNIILLVGMMASFSVLQAQTEDDSDSNENETQTQEQQTAKKRKEPEKNDTFIPTEEISEDAPVAFPVDI